ncbi:MAG TPA: MBL fold metallo-hydrolase [Acidimicrobiales bacterium]|nr:MBL fold metallo-hydrolase [Acidimicrobiales bacterium]
MRLTAFRADEGDCLLLESADGHRMLVDGGTQDAYATHVAPALGQLRQKGKHLDIVCITHIDADHISGILRLLDDEAAWRVHDHQVGHGNANHRLPPAARPAEVDTILHNSFHDQVSKNTGRIETMLAASAGFLSATTDGRLTSVAAAQRDLAASIPQALRVSRRLRPDQLNIPHNPQFGGKLALVSDDTPDLALGSVRLELLAPFPRDVTKLRRDWDTWLRAHQEAVDRIRDRAERDAGDLRMSEVDRLLAPRFRAAETLGDAELALAEQLGLRSNVTTPNLASLMFLAEEDGTTVLLTGDGHADDILNGLDHHKALDDRGRLHVTVLKVQHHGSEHNIHQRFCDAITADDYVLTGDGKHENPNLTVLELIHDRRMANDQRKFSFWFTSTSTLSATEEGRDHMTKVEALARELAARSGGRLTNHFVEGSSIRILP